MAACLHREQLLLSFLSRGEEEARLLLSLDASLQKELSLSLSFSLPLFAERRGNARLVSRCDISTSYDYVTRIINNFPSRGMFQCFFRLVTLFQDGEIRDPKNKGNFWNWLIRVMTFGRSLYTEVKGREKTRTRGNRYASWILLLLFLHREIGKRAF